MALFRQQCRQNKSPSQGWTFFISRHAPGTVDKGFVKSRTGLGASHRFPRWNPVWSPVDSRPRPPRRIVAAGREPRSPVPGRWRSGLLAAEERLHEQSAAALLPGPPVRSKRSMCSVSRTAGEFGELCSELTSLGHRPAPLRGSPGRAATGLPARSPKKPGCDAPPGERAIPGTPSPVPQIANLHPRLRLSCSWLLALTHRLSA